MENKKLLQLFTILSIIFLTASFVIEYIPGAVFGFSILKEHMDFYENIVLGLFTGTFVSAISAAIMYKNYQSGLAQRFEQHMFNMLLYLKHLYSKTNYAEIDDEWALRDGVDYSLSFYTEIIKECDIIRQDLEIKNIFAKNRNLYDEIMKEVLTIRQYAAVTSRTLRLTNDLQNIQIILGGINAKVDTYSANLIELLTAFAKMQGMKGEKLDEYQKTLEILAPK